MTAVRPENRPLIALVPEGNRHGSRSHVTCFFRCGNACDQPEPNPTDHPHIRDEITKAVARRAVLRGGAAGAGAVLVGSVVGTGSLAAAATTTGVSRAAAAAGPLGTHRFRPVTPNKRDAFTVPTGYRTSVVMKWGDPVVLGAPDFDPAEQSVAAAEKQFGFNCDYVGVLPLTRSTSLLVVNHEYTTEPHMFPAGVYSDDEIKRISMTNHGMSVVKIVRGTTPGSWRQVGNLKTCKENRRIHIRTAFRMTGPAAGDARLRTSADPTGKKVLGTLNNCAGGTTPWGTVLSGEENFNQYFDAGAGLDPAFATEYARYGITGAGRGWGTVDSRFDLSQEPHEPHRFGWVVEVDPYDARSTPAKHTMLGRFKHEGANIALTRSGYAVAYMGDDERGDYLYKFVSAERMDKAKTAKAKRHNMTLLTKGTLYVAKLTGDGDADGKFDGTGRWMRLCTDKQSFVPGMSVADVLIFTRLAADKLGPTKMDRPEDVEPNPVNGKVYAALTNNSDRGKPAMPADEANPVTTSKVRASLGAPLTDASGNRNGYVLELSPDKGVHSTSSFTWNLFLVCGDPAAPESYFGGFDKSKVSPISCPDNVAFDSRGNLWISTDGNVLGSNDGVFRVPVSGPNRGQVQQFCTVPKGAEACGPLITDGDRSLFVAVQHPGEISGATFEAPASTWPHTDNFPRPAVVVAYLDR
ncbi:phosphatase [Nocardioides sp. Root190]|uniref:PhoX family protein n=1 Tax=Nocardioides sp. Root190 TaxID=1736488 RepID=UPI0006FA4164|nr:PhoX family phosphatase [Nocardioides sp. Root190]KRB77335.1 phosphatase [Nocardioides sp. Root190]